MTSKEVFQKIHAENNSELYVNNFKVNGEIGSYIHITQYHLKVFYNSDLMDVFYDFGNSDSALITINLPSSHTFPEFQLTTMDHITKLFFFRKKNWRLKCKHPRLSKKIETLLRKHSLIDLIENTGFEPTITGNLSISSYKVTTRFSLSYSENITSINTIFDFHKGLIDLIKEK
ncbi:conserved hypothetical protein [Tenacibaculum sp. 190524A02b]|uniref:Uncharacterized protein n=1 Tax=Tenacibaculum vairaonense TaxID=3137860 RepID=A0ABM9PH89_9FLAO